MAEEIDLEKCNFRKISGPMTLTLTLDQIEVTLMHISGRGLPTHQTTSKSKKKLLVDVRTYGRTDGWTDTPYFSKSIRPSPESTARGLHDGHRRQHARLVAAYVQS